MGGKRVQRPLARRRLLRAAGLAGAGLALSGCSWARALLDLVEGRGMSGIEVADTDSACALALDCLRERYGEGFARVDGADVVVADNDFPAEITRYEILVAPEGSPEKMFTVSIKRRRDDHMLWGLICDNYQQYLFIPVVCGPFEDYLAGLDGVDGYSVSLFYNKMDDEVWTEDQVEEYMGAGRQGDPEVFVTAMVARAPAEDLARLVHRMHLDLAGLGRSMLISTSITGSDIWKDGNEIYRTHLGYEILASRGEAKLDYADVLDEVASNMKRVTDDGWDGTVEPGDLDRTIPSITWK